MQKPADRVDYGNGHLRLFTAVAGAVCFVVMLVLAILFYRERTLTFDLARQGFLNLLDHRIAMYLRPVAFVPQLVPWALRWLNCPLDVILRYYSAGFVFFYFALFAVIVFGLRQYVAGLVFLLALMLLVNDTFYCFQSDLHQGLLWLIVYYAYIEHRGPAPTCKQKWFDAAFVFFLLFAHPLMVFAVLYVTLFYLHQHHGLKFAFYRRGLGVIAAGFCVRMAASRLNPYESNKLDIAARFNHHRYFITGLAHRLTGAAGAHFYLLVAGIALAGGLVIAAWRKPVLATVATTIVIVVASIAQFLKPGLAAQFTCVGTLVHYAGSDYLVYWLVVLFTVIILYTGRQYTQLWLLCVFTAGYLLLVCALNRTAPRFYLESLLLPLALFVLLPFAGWLAYSSRKRALVLMLPALIIGVRLTFVYAAHDRYTRRLTWYTERFAEMDRMHIDKLMLTERQANMDTLIMSWATGYESVMLSSLQGPGHTKSVVVDTGLAPYRAYLNCDTVWAGKFDIITPHRLPLQYFIMPKGRYMVLEN